MMAHRRHSFLVIFYVLFVVVALWMNTQIEANELRGGERPTEQEIHSDTEGLEVEQEHRSLFNSDVLENQNFFGRIILAKMMEFFWLLLCFTPYGCIPPVEPATDDQSP